MKWKSLKKVANCDSNELVPLLPWVSIHYSWTYTTTDITTKVKDSWKFAAVEIYSLINQVRENGLDDVHEMETKMRGLLATMKQQTDIIDQLNNDLKHQKQASGQKYHAAAQNVY